MQALQESMKTRFGDFFLSCKECVLENPRSFYGAFSLGPFQNSQSLTVANALRRTLLTEIFGIAITNVEIEGVFHEYSTIEGVRESVLDIFLNFKQIVLKTSSILQNPVYGYLNVRGPGIVCVSDLKLPPNIQYVDPDQYIATLNENGKLCLKVTISDSSSFSRVPLKIVSAEGNGQKTDGKSDQSFSSENSSEKKKEGYLKKKNSFDFPSQFEPNFHPLLKVNYLIESLQPLQNSLQNEILHLELWTNGSVHPRKALSSALHFLKTMFEKFEIMEKGNAKMTHSFFESDETFVRILKTFEYDFQFYSTIESNSSFSPLQTFHVEPFFIAEQAKQKKNAKQFFYSQTSEEKKLEQEKQNFEQLPVSSPTLKGDGQGGGPQKQVEDAIFQSDAFGHFSNFETSSQKSVSSLFQKFTFNSSIQVLNLPYRVSQSLIQNNLLTIKDLVKFCPKELKELSGLGNFSVSLIQKKLHKIGFVLKSSKKTN